MLLPYGLIGIGLGLLLIALSKKSDESTAGEPAKEIKDGKIPTVGKDGVDGVSSNRDSVKRRRRKGRNGSRGLVVPLKPETSEDERIENAKTTNAISSSSGNDNVGKQNSDVVKPGENGGLTDDGTRIQNNGKNGDGDSGDDVHLQPGSEAVTGDK